MTLNAIILVLWVVRILFILSVGYALVNVTADWTYLLAFIACATLPIALVLAWPLRKEDTLDS